MVKEGLFQPHQAKASYPLSCGKWEFLPLEMSVKYFGLLVSDLQHCVTQLPTGRQNNISSDFVGR